MKYRALLAATAIISMNVTSPAFAAVTLIDPTPAANPGQVVLDGMQTQCDALAAAHDTNNGDIWSAAVVLGAVTYVSGPTETGSHSIADAIGSPVGAGTFTPAHRDILGDPFRNGGSVNMFGIQEAVGGYYSASTYDFEGTFTTTYAHAFSCDISDAVYHAAVHHDAVHHDQVGHWVVAPDAHGNEEANTNNCNAFNTALPLGPPQGGNTQANCLYIVDQSAFDDPAYDDPAYNDAPVFVVNEAGTTINVDQTDQLLAHEDAGEGFSTSETLLLGQVVVCISPKKLPGTWTKQNGYVGTKCTTAWYTTGATIGVSNLNTGSHNYVTVPVL